MQTNIVNKFGTLLGWKAVVFNLLGRDVEGITEISYEDAMEINSEYGAGDMPIGTGEGNYSAKGEISILIEEHIGLMKSMPPGTRVQSITIPAIPVIYGLNSVATKDIINNARITGQGRQFKQGDGKIVIKLPFIASHIDWNV